MWTIAGRTVGVVLLGAVLSGCSTASWNLVPRHMGFRPDEPPPAETNESICQEYKKYVVYAQELQESYHSRATQNRWWIYAAGIIGLGTVAATGGLAAATAVSVGTLALLSVSGGFTTGVFATLDNAALADIYTIAANRVDTAARKADALIPFPSTPPKRDGTVSKTEGVNRYTDDAKCRDALVRLKALVSEARTKLERARTNSAMQAVERAADQQTALRQLVASLPPDPTVVVLRAEITKITRTPEGAGVKLTVSNIRLGTVTVDEMKVFVGEQEVDVSGFNSTTSPDVWEVSFNAPASPPKASQFDYAPVLIVGADERRVECAKDVVLSYPKPQ